VIYQSKWWTKRGNWEHMEVLGHTSLSLNVTGKGQRESGISTRGHPENRDLRVKP